jgi:hypothetical protein
MISVVVAFLKKFSAYIKIKITTNPILSFLIIIIIANLLRAFFTTHFVVNESKFTYLFVYGVSLALLGACIRYFFFGGISFLKERFFKENSKGSLVLLQQTELQFPEEFKHKFYCSIWTYTVTVLVILVIFLVSRAPQFAMPFASLIMICLYFIRYHSENYIIALKKTIIPLEMEPTFIRPINFLANSVYNTQVMLYGILDELAASRWGWGRPKVGASSASLYSGKIGPKNIWLRGFHAKATPFWGYGSAIVGVLCAADALIHLNSLERNYSSQLITRVSEGVVCPSVTTYNKLSELKELNANVKDYCFPETNVIDKVAVDISMDIYDKQREVYVNNQDAEMIIQRPVSIHKVKWDAIHAAEKEHRFEK